MRWLWAAIVLLLGRARRTRRAIERRRIVADAPPCPRAELLVLLLFACATACAAAFVAVYALDRLPHQTQLLGLALGLALAFLAAAAIVIGKRLVPQEELAEPYPAEEHSVFSRRCVCFAPLCWPRGCSSRSINRSSMRSPFTGMKSPTAPRRDWSRSTTRFFDPVTRGRPSSNCGARGC